MGLLRLWLALAVVFVHAGGLPFYKSLNGLLAVKCFYVISGFYMTLIRRKYEGRHGLFLTNRFMRLWPVYFAVLILTVAAWKLAPTVLPAYASVGGTCWSDPPNKPSTAIILAASNATLFGQDALMFVAVNPDSGELGFTHDFRKEPLPAFGYLFVPQAWSVSLELLFYLVAPFLTRLHPALLMSIGLGSVGVRAACRGVGWIDDPWNYRFFPAELYCFVLGILACRFYEWQCAKNTEKREWDRLICAALAAGILAIEYVALPYKNHGMPLVVAAALPSLFRISGKSPLDRAVGELSYPVYIVHLLVMGFAIPFCGVPDGAGHLLPFTTAAFSLLFGWVLYRVVDVPVDRWRQRRADPNRSFSA